MSQRDVHPSDELLEAIAQALRNTDDLGHTSWYDAAEHRVLMLTFDPMDEPLEPLDEMPDWLREEHALAERISADPERFRELIGTGTPGRLHEFMDSVADDALRERLHDVARGGRGAYRRVRDLLHREGLEQLWYDFEAVEDRQLARKWLFEEGLLASSDPDDEDGTVLPFPKKA